MDFQGYFFGFYFDILEPFSHTEGKIFFSCNSLAEWHELCLFLQSARASSGFPGMWIGCSAN